MFKKSLLTLMLMAAVSQAAVKELIPNLTSDDLQVQTQARLDVLAACSKASAPDAPQGSREAICKEMCTILEGDYPVVEVIQPVLNNLERIGGAESVSTLVKLMNHKDPNIRDDARRALAVNPSNEAAQALVAALRSRKARSPETTAGLIYALGERKQAGASKLISGALGSKDEVVFIAAVKVLGMLNEDAGVNALLERRAQEKGFRKTQVDAALLSTLRKTVYTTFLAEGEPDQLRAAATAGLILSGEVSRAVKAMASGDTAQQAGVIEAAKQGLNPIVMDVVAEALPNLPPHNQLKAVVALQASGNRKYAGNVEPLLGSGDWFVQAVAANALASIGTADSVPALVALGSKDARRSLGRLNLKGVDAQLERLAASGDSKNRETAIEALANRGRVDLIPTFFKYAAEEDRGVASTAAKAIAGIGNDATVAPMVDLMIEKEKAPVSRDLLNGIVKIMRTSPDQRGLVDMLVAKMNGASSRSQANILKALAQSGSKAALPPLVEACRSSDEALQKTAIKALGGWKERNGIDTMLALAGDDSISLKDHVILMRGVSRIYASISSWQLSRYKGGIEKAIETCRRQEEKDALQATLDKVK
ncbi:HEAT repeat domain-containing protein [Pontiella agarivorans]|uniref:HEAT repeat domain-containing protein n=1 Tax=Pontiella agarivorans TaxID=3038953 RepID=A0ABU5MZP6_9BACT|nr:HEAT repeat domain-containing protein [Pontiella agarivorans]MDZ8119662.1 HEAT repeat domain-containing protein [Pontiella agarivorans]